MESGEIKPWMILNQDYLYDEDAANFVQDDIKKFSGRTKKKSCLFEFS